MAVLFVLDLHFLYTVAVFSLLDPCVLYIRSESGVVKIGVFTLRTNAPSKQKYEEISK